MGPGRFRRVAALATPLALGVLTVSAQVGRHPAIPASGPAGSVGVGARLAHSAAVVVEAGPAVVPTVPVGVPTVPLPTIVPPNPPLPTVPLPTLAVPTAIPTRLIATAIPTRLIATAIPTRLIATAIPTRLIATAIPTRPIATAVAAAGAPSATPTPHDPTPTRPAGSRNPPATAPAGPHPGGAATAAPGAGEAALPPPSATAAPHPPPSGSGGQPPPGKGPGAPGAPGAQSGPRISLNTAAVAPGRPVVVSGQGFAPGEHITLALDGVALTTARPIVASRHGRFTATFLAPRGLIAGANTVSAIGTSSHVATVARLRGLRRGSTQLYFAGGMNSGGEQSVLSLLNPNNARTRIRLTFYFANGAMETRSLTLAPRTQQVGLVDSLVQHSGPFGLMVMAHPGVSAQLNVIRPGQDGDALLGNTELDTTWYLAEGYTGLSFHETVALLNPALARPAHVLLRLLPIGGRGARTVRVTIPAHTNLVEDVNALLPRKSLSIVATADRPIMVERTMAFGANGYGLTTRAATDVAAASWLFAEGTTAAGFQTFLTILNPRARTASVTARFYGRTGELLASRRLVVAGRSRTNIMLNRFLHTSGIASMVLSNQPVVVERPEYVGSPNAAGVAGSDVFGRNGVALYWSFPGGATAGANEFLLLYNPSPHTIPVEVTVYGVSGVVAIKRVYVAPTVRYTLNVATLFPRAIDLHGATLRSLDGQGFVAEQTVFAPDHSTLQSTEGLAQ